ncbi:MAG: LOW QUALITY PROTEIN: uncharacterized protein KVP18_001587 [Porospora cf. gigantea A]|uniref:uncharacterized protein n=1 Tax=Porospora cf. gigantea A TaxID=2853593 RepID=UPI00355A8DBC|nr:MAG: LOW QUALITY PROTEIN: hypothetical protein KVP18_001587 [Porospora cf. gigantea A]
MSTTGAYKGLTQSVCPIAGIDLEHHGLLFQFNSIREWKRDVTNADLKILRTKVNRFLEQYTLKQIDLCHALGLAQTYMSFFVREGMQASLGPRKRVEFWAVLTEFFRQITEETFPMTQLIELRDDRAQRREHARVNRRAWGELSGRRKSSPLTSKDIEPFIDPTNVGRQAKEGTGWLTNSRQEFQHVLANGYSDLWQLSDICLQYRQQEYDHLGRPGMLDGLARFESNYDDLDPFLSQADAAGQALFLPESVGSDSPKKKRRKKHDFDVRAPAFALMSPPVTASKRRIGVLCLPFFSTFVTRHKAPRRYLEKVRWSGGLFCLSTLRRLLTPRTLPAIDDIACDLDEQQGPHEWVLWNLYEAPSVLYAYIVTRIGRELGHDAEFVDKVHAQCQLQTADQRFINLAFEEAVKAAGDRLHDEVREAFGFYAAESVTESSDEAPDGDAPESEVVDVPITNLNQAPERALANAEARLKALCTRRICLEVKMQELGYAVSDAFHWDLRSPPELMAALFDDSPIKAHLYIAGIRQLMLLRREFALQTHRALRPDPNHMTLEQRFKRQPETVEWPLPFKVHGDDSDVRQRRELTSCRPRGGGQSPSPPSESEPAPGIRTRLRRSMRLDTQRTEDVEGSPMSEGSSDEEDLSSISLD